MNFRILNYFLTVAHEKNITKAAEIMHITQPTLSRKQRWASSFSTVTSINLRSRHRGNSSLNAPAKS